MSVTVDDMLKDAIAGTEAEIFNEAVGKDGPSTEGGPGDRSVEEMGTGLEGQVEADSAEAETEIEAVAEAGAEGETEVVAEPEEGDKQPTDPKTGQFVAKPSGETQPAKAGEEKPVDPKARVPLAELITERKARQALQDELKTEREGRVADKAQSQSEFQRLNARLDQMLAGVKPATPTAADQTAAEKPDIFTNPDAYVANLKQELTNEFAGRYLNADMARTHKAQGKVFEDAYAAITSQAKTDPLVQAEVRKIWNSPTPGDDLISWHKKQETLKVVGDDPAAYTAKVQAEAREQLMKDPEFRKQVADALRTESGQGGVQKPAIRLPKSLNGASGGNAGGVAVTASDNSDRGVFEDAFK